MTIGQDIDKMIAKLRQQRDELKLQAHLMKADAKDEWREVEDQWQKLENRFQRAQAAGAEAGDDVAEGLRTLGGKIQEGFDKVRRSI